MFIKRQAISVILMLSLQGCSYVEPPKIDFEYFDAMPARGRVLEAPKILWQPREDNEQICSLITGIPITPMSKPVACAYWNITRNECTIITAPRYKINYLGHEARHCYEGKFHD